MVVGGARGGWQGSHDIVKLLGKMRHQRVQQITEMAISKHHMDSERHNTDVKEKVHFVYQMCYIHDMKPLPP